MSWTTIETELPPQGTPVLLKTTTAMVFVGYRDGNEYYGVIDDSDLPMTETIAEWMYIPE